MQAFLLIFLRKELPPASGRYSARESVWGCVFKDYIGQSSTESFGGEGRKIVRASYEMTSKSDSVLYHVDEAWYALPDDAVAFAVAYPAVSNEPEMLEYIKVVENLLTGRVKARG